MTHQQHILTSIVNAEIAAGFIPLIILVLSQRHHLIILPQRQQLHVEGRLLAVKHAQHRRLQPAARVCVNLKQDWQWNQSKGRERVPTVKRWAGVRGCTDKDSTAQTLRCAPFNNCCQ
jgi:hypothetical protein